MLYHLIQPRSRRNSALNHIALNCPGLIVCNNCTASTVLTATIAQFSYNMGAYGVKYALELANGGSIDINIDTGTQLVTTANANDFK